MGMLHSELRLGIAQALGRRDFFFAEQLYEQAVARTKEDPDLLLIRGAIYSEQGRHDKACGVLARAHKAAPRRGDISYNYGVALQRSGRLAEAVGAWTHTTRDAPENPAAWLNLALATAELASPHSALAVYRSALRHHPRHGDLVYNYANLLCRLGKFEKSESQYRMLIGLDPSHAPGWVNYGMLLKSQQRFAEAEACYRQAMRAAAPEFAPQVEFNLANLLLQTGRWQEGFAAYEARLELPGALSNPWGLPEWQPQLARGKRVLLWSDQGLGDAIMFLRFAERLAERGYRVSAFVQTALKSLAASAPGIDAVFSPADDPGEADAALALGSLPHALGITAEETWKEPYLSAPDLPVPPPVKNSKRVGLVWAGNPNHPNDENRSIKLRQFRPLFALDNIDWYSLQVGAGAAQLAHLPMRDLVRDAGPHLRDFSATAGILASLDLLISVDSAPAHLAGAMGKSVWTLLPAVGTDWRWQAEGSRTVWYPSMRLFRQHRAGDWDSLMISVRDALRRL